MKEQATFPAPPAPQQSDNLCKRLAEQFPADFVRWAFGVTGAIKVDKTELNREPIRADAAIFSHENKETLPAEFQTTMKSDVPVPLRLLDYYVGYRHQEKEFHHEEHKGHEEKAKREVASLENQRLRAQVV